MCLACLTICRNLNVYHVLKGECQESQLATGLGQIQFIEKGPI